MNVSCGSCPAKYAVPDEKVRGKKVRIKCKRCGAAIIIDGTVSSLQSGVAEGPAQSADAQPTAPRRAPPPAPIRAAEPVTHAAQRPAPGRAAPDRASPGVPPVAARPSPKKTMIGIAAPAPPLPAAAPGPPIGQQVVVSAKGRAPDVSPAKRAMRQTIIGGMQGPAAVPAAPAEPALPPVSGAVAKAEEPRWTVTLSDKKTDELSTAEVVALYAVGKIGDQTLIWRDGMLSWVPPFEIPEIARALRSRGLAPRAHTGKTPPPKAPPPMPATPAGRFGDELADAEDDEATIMTGSPADAQDSFPPPRRVPADGSASRGYWREPGLHAPQPARDGPAASASSLNDVDDDDEITRAMDAPWAESRPISDAPIPDTERPPAGVTVPRQAPPAMRWTAPMPGAAPTQRGEEDEEVTQALDASASEAIMKSAPLPEREPLPPIAPGAPSRQLAMPNLDALSGPMRAQPSRSGVLIAIVTIPLALLLAVVLVHNFQKPAAVYAALEKLPRPIADLLDLAAAVLPGGPDPKAVETSEPPVPTAAATGSPAGAAQADFDRQAASKVLNDVRLDSCKTPNGPIGSGRAEITYAPTGQATDAAVSGKFNDTPVGDCMVRLLRGTRVPPFRGPPVRVAKSFRIY